MLRTNSARAVRAMLFLLLALGPAMAARQARAQAPDTLTFAFVIASDEPAAIIGSRRAEVVDSVLATFADEFPYWVFTVAAEGATPCCRLTLLGDDGSQLQLDLF